MKSLFLRGLWGQGPDAGPNQTETLDKTRHDISRSLKVKHQPTPLTVGAYGRENFQHLKGLGVRWPVLLNPRPIVNFEYSDQARVSQNNGRINWGLSMWRHKLEIIKWGLGLSDEVVWLDWDIHQVAEMPQDFWERLRDGAPLRAALRCYQNPQCMWRGRREKRMVPHGAFIYCRDRTLIERAIWWHTNHHPESTDEVAMAHLIDERMGGWQGAQAYADAGYQAPWYNMRMRHGLPGPARADAVFRNKGRY